MKEVLVMSIGYRLSKSVKYYASSRGRGNSVNGYESQFDIFGTGLTITKDAYEIC